MTLCPDCRIISFQGDCLRDFPYIKDGRNRKPIHLNLSGNCIDKNSVFPFSNPANHIRCLDLSYNTMGEIPEGIGKLMPGLTTLILSANEIKEFPEFICDELVHLTYLSLSDNMLRVLPTCIGRLGSLKYLDVGHNYVCELPKEIGKLKNLQELRVKDNRLRYLPDTLQNLQKLQIIDASSNEIVEFPYWIPLLNLEFLNFKRNRIEGVPGNIGTASSLLELNLRFNLLEKVPLSIANLSEDCELKLYDNPNSFNLHELREKWLNQGFSKEYAEYFSETFGVLNRLNLPYDMIEYIKTFLRIRDIVFL